MKKLNQKEVNSLLSGNTTDYKFYEPTIDDQNKIITFYDFALEMLESACFFLTNLSRAHEMVVKHNYTSPHLKNNVIELENSIRLCEQAIEVKKLASCPLSNYKRRVDMIKWRLQKINKNGLFEEHKKYLPIIQEAYTVIKDSIQE